MTAIYIQDGDAIDHIPTTALPAGAVVVQGRLVGITPRPIPAGSIGAIQIGGVFDLPITPGSTVGIGEPVFWNPATTLATLDGTVVGVVAAGVTVLPLSATDVAVRVLINHPH
jgi:predicted RecA/RadA family phage recombinase